MPTKTKAVNESITGTPRIRLDDDRRTKIAALLGCSGEQANLALAEIERVLSLGSSRIHARETEPLPANLLAELRPVTNLAHKLATAIGQLSIKARLRTRMVDGSDSPSVLWNALIEFRTNAQIACDRLEQEGHDYQGAVRSGAIDIPVPGSDGGSRKKSVKTARDGVGDLIGGIYDQCAANPTLKGRATFLQLVTGRRQRG